MTETIGPQLDRAAAGTDPRGILTFEYLSDDMQRSEDSTAVADRDRARMLSPRGHEREATSTERQLLSHLGYTLPDELTTKVSWPSRSVRRRTWPQLEGQQP